MPEEDEIQMAIRAVIWDLDGTLLDTLSDLCNSVNAALQMHNLPLHTIDEVRTFVGGGIKNLIDRSVPAGYDPEKTAQVLADFTAHYAEHSKDLTRPYDGILDTLDALLARGVKMGIVSNKIDFAVKELSREYFGDRMLVSVGDDPSRPRKPAPDSVWEAMRQLGVTKEETVYVGDSDVDVYTAHNAGLPCVAVSWGFRSRECLVSAGADVIADTTEALFEALMTL